MSNRNLNKGIEVNILDKEYLISCPEEEHSALRSAARLLDKKMKDIRASGKVVGSDRIAVIAALNIAHDLISLNTTESQNISDNSTKSRIHAMQEKIDKALKNQCELKL